MKGFSFLLIFTLVLLAGCGTAPPRTETAAVDPVPVQASAAAAAEWPVTYEAVGTVRARTSAVISSKVMGYIREVKAQAGDRVAEGAPLVILDSRDLDAQHRRAQAGLNEANSARAEVESAAAGSAANLELAEVTFRRMEDLFEKRSISNQEFDEASARLKAAQANHQMALSRRQQLEARIAQAEEAYRSAEIMRSYTEIRAPFAARVTEKRVDPGDLATPGAPLLTLEREGAYRLEASVEESLLPQIRAGHRVSVALEALGRTLEGRVTEVVPAVDPASRTYLVKIELPSLPEIRSGMFGRAAFDLGVRQVVTVPAEAVIERGQLQSVLVAEDGAARTRLVTLGRSRDGGREVLSGLDHGEIVIHPVPAGLSDGAPVEVRP